MADSSTHNMLFATLELLNTVIELASHNKALATEWSMQQDHARALIGLLTSMPDQSAVTNPTIEILIKQTCVAVDAFGDKFPKIADATPVSLGLDSLSMSPY